MIDFAEARKIVEATIPGGGATADHGYEDDTYWFPIIEPQRIGGRVPAVTKDRGELVWMSSVDDRFSESANYGASHP
jgi:hypothetical protein